MSEAHVPQGEAVLDWKGAPVATLTNIEFTGSTSTVDYTNNDSEGGTSEFIPGLRDLGEISADFVANADNASTLHTDWVNKAVEDFDITFWGSGFQKTGEGFISEFSITAELTGESVVEGSITIKIKSEGAGS